jgi:hypothetical protein
MSPAGSFRTATVAGLTEFFDCAVDEDGHQSKRMFPSASAIARERDKLWISMPWRWLVLIREIANTVKFFYINFEKAIRLMLDASGLSEYAKSGPVHLAVTSDGANSFCNRTQISSGIKVCDSRAHHMKTKTPVLVEDDEQPAHYIGVQSSEMCTILIMADARDKANMYEELFGDFYRYTIS